MPANMVVPLLPQIAQLRGIFIEYGAQDNFSHIVLGAQELAQRLSLARNLLHARGLPGPITGTTSSSASASTCSPGSHDVHRRKINPLHCGIPVFSGPLK